MKALLGLGALSLSLLPPSLGQAEQMQLGRLFFTPAQRKQQDISQLQARDSATPDSLTLNGIVQKNGGARTIWINGVPQVTGKSDEHNPNSVPLAIPHLVNPITVKVGQKINVMPSDGEDH